MSTPLIKPLNIQGGTFYTFASASEDISKTFSDDNARFVFSKFVALKLPDVATPISQSNNVVWEAIGVSGSVPLSSLSTNQNVNFAQSFQNYVLNFEDVILGGKNNLSIDYDTELLDTVCERLFWKWLVDLNAIRFKDANLTNESNNSNRYREELGATGSLRYSPVVKYIGDIDVINNISRDGHAYTEVYIHIPTSHGSTPLVLWKQLADNNYKPGMYWTGSGEYIEGRSSTSTHPAGLDMHAYYDDDLNDKYGGSTAFGLVGNTVYTTESSKQILISGMDGVVIDFDENSYIPITSRPDIQSMNQFNTVAESSDFEFNMVLIYYDVYDASTPSKRATNLYGILVLDDYTNTTDGGYLKPYQKYKPNPITKMNGNGYGLKMNLKFDTSVDNVGVETIINDYNTFSMDLFVDAATRLQEAADMFTQQKFEYIELRNRIQTLEEFYYTQDDLYEVKRQITELQNQINNANLAYQDSTTLLDLINNNANNINLIMQGQTPLQIAYNLDLIDKGNGIGIDRSVPNKLTISNVQQEYSTFGKCLTPSGYLSYALNNGTNYVFNTNDPNYSVDNNVITLGAFKNYYLNTSPANTGFIDDLTININDTNIRWQTGQVYRMKFENAIKLNGYTIKFKTDANDKFGDGNYGKTIGILNELDLISDTPIIDIICVSTDTYEFYIDVIK